MAGDDIKIAASGFLMIHNAWTIAMGNKNDMREMADVLDSFDESMAGVYSRQTGKSEKEIHKLMDGESWISGADAVEQGFANGLLESDQVSIDENEKNAYSSSLRKVDSALAKIGMPRSERRSLIKEISTPRAADPADVTPRADDGLVQALTSLMKTTSQKD